MIKEGQIVLFKFPLADKFDAKLRPALVLKKLPGHHLGRNITVYGKFDLIEESEKWLIDRYSDDMNRG